MPVLNGHNATAVLRESGYTGLIVALTAVGTTEELRRLYRIIGHDELVSKPFHPSQLIESTFMKLFVLAESDTSCQ